MRKFLKLFKYASLITCLGFMALIASCSTTRVILQTAPNKPANKPAIPPLDYADLSRWKAARPDVQTKLEAQIYGQVPIANAIKLKSDTIFERTYNAKARIEEWTVGFEGVYRGPNNQEIYSPQQTFKMVVVVPRKAKGDVPVIMMQNFCPNHNVIPKAGISKPETSRFDCGGQDMGAKIMSYVFGRYIVSPPVEDILARGYALAVVHPPDFVPDNAERGLAKLGEILPESRAIGAWAAQFDAMAITLDQDGRFSHQIAYGHSRYGKSALLAAAFSRNINGVIAHQSGTGGASLSRDKRGETVAQITESYPHWFADNYAEDALTIDQHHLLALIAPRPILLGNAKRDVWSDPEGAFRAAQGANSIYALYGSRGLKQSRLGDYDPQADIAFWIRPGTHGVVKEDWPAFLDFLDAHFKGEDFK